MHLYFLSRNASLVLYTNLCINHKHVFYSSSRCTSHYLACMHFVCEWERERERAQRLQGFSLLACGGSYQKEKRTKAMSCRRGSRGWKKELSPMCWPFGQEKGWIEKRELVCLFTQERRREAPLMCWKSINRRAAERLQNQCINLG